MKCLDVFDLYAGDGHFIAAASHDKATPRKSPAKKKPVSRAAAFTATKYAIQRLTQRTVKFIRWLKNHLDSRRSWQHALARLVKIDARS